MAGRLFIFHNAKLCGMILVLSYSYCCIEQERYTRGATLLSIRVDIRPASTVPSRPSAPTHRLTTRPPAANPIPNPVRDPNHKFYSNPNPSKLST